MKRLLLHRDIILFKSCICLVFSKLAFLKRRVVSQPPCALLRFHRSFSTVFIFPMIPIINRHWYMLNSDASLFDLQIHSVCSNITQVSHSRVLGVYGNTIQGWGTASLLNLPPLTVTFPQIHREKKKQGRIFPCWRPFRYHWETTHKNTSNVIPPLTWEKSSIPRPEKLCQGLQVSHSCLKYAVSLKIPSQFVRGWLRLPALSQEMSNPCRVIVPRRSSGCSPTCDSLYKHRFFDRLRNKCLWEFLVFFPWKQFLRELYCLSGKGQAHAVRYLYSWLITLPLYSFSRGLVIHGPTNPFSNLTR